MDRNGWFARSETLLEDSARDNLKKSLALPPPADARGTPTVEELNAVLLHYLVQDKGGQHIRTWGTLELESELCLGVQRVRCFPFKCDKAWKSNPKNYVALFDPFWRTRRTNTIGLIAPKLCRPRDLAQNRRIPKGRIHSRQ